MTPEQLAREPTPETDAEAYNDIGPPDDFVNTEFARSLEQRHRVAVRALEEAIESIEHWGAYADRYFQDKHDLKGELERLRALLPALRGEA